MNLGQVRYALVGNASRFLRANSKRTFGSSVVSMKEREKEQWTKVKEKWDRPKEEWNSVFHYFLPDKGVSIDLIHKLHKPIDISPKSIMKWFNKVKRTKAVFEQSFLQERVAAVGCELAAAHFIVYRGGKIIQKGSNEWIVMDEDEEYNVPRHYTPGYFVECIDASGTNLLYEGLECLSNLEHLKWLNLANCVNIDDWCIDRLCGQYNSTLEYLNLSNCTLITERGIAALARLKQLKTLDLTGLQGIPNIELLCLLIEDVIPNIEIIGINYMELPGQ